MTPLSPAIYLADLHACNEGLQFWIGQNGDAVHLYSGVPCSSPCSSTVNLDVSFEFSVSVHGKYGLVPLERPPESILYQ